MEKRLFLALFLSFAVLWLWSSFFPAPRPHVNKTELLQVIENKKDLILEDSKNDSSESVPEKSKVSLEKIERLENGKFVLEFSNIGGTLKHVYLKEYNVTLPLENFVTIDGTETKAFNLLEISKNKIVYTIFYNNNEITKSYEISENDYIVHSRIKLNNNIIKFRNFDLNMSNLDQNLRQEFSLFEYDIKTDKRIFRKNNAHQFKEKDSSVIKENLEWVGFRNRYFCAIVKPLYDAGSVEISVFDSKKMTILNGVNHESAKNQNEFDAIIFVGPEKSALLKKYNFGFEEIKKYYRFELFDAMGKIVYSFVHFIHNIVKNWGVSIILLAIFIYFLTYPLSMRSMLSMRKMQSVQPKIVALKEKYKNNPQKLNKEIMDIYKENKINPLGGCLPVLLQMPIFIGLYQALYRDVDFDGARFLWIKDLSSPDRIFHLPVNLPIIGNEVNILPISMIIIMYFQQKLTARNMVYTDDMQASQQKMMSVIMPVFMGFIFYKFASGLSLYFSVFYLLSTFTQWKLSKNT